MADTKNQFSMCTIELVVPDNMGIDAGITLLSPLDSVILDGLGP